MDLMANRHCEFFCNLECEFLPCHETDDPDNFNCLFCFCPLYALGRHCGGNFRYQDNGIKDCSGCDFPHRRENYGEIVGRFAEIRDLMDGYS
ncbi:MAG: cysteine-rich small domain-containing protein [Butyricicoccus sp.]|nr:cysteine-rich small domain-containing protein [Butyricicoccus sp.]